MVTGLSEPLRSEKPVLHAAFLTFYYVHLKMGMGFCGGVLGYIQVHLLKSVGEYSSPFLGKWSFCGVRVSLPVFVLLKCIFLV